MSAGSLLEFVLEEADFRMPVGRIQFMYLHPLSFNEFLLATAQEELHQYLAEIKLSTKIPLAVHQHLLKQLHEYSILGGMPAIIDAYLERKDLQYCQQLQNNLLNIYRHDFGKYAMRNEHRHLQQLYPLHLKMRTLTSSLRRICDFLQSKKLKIEQLFLRFFSIRKSQLLVI